VDASGRSVIDPTKNVDALVSAAIQRQDDLREMEAKHTRELNAMRDIHADQLRTSESARLDAIRSVDITAVQRAAEVSATQAATLAPQVTASADALRIAVEQAAVQARTSLSLALEPIQKDIADLRRVQYEAAGSKTQVIDTRDSRADSRANLAIVISIGFGLLTIIAMILVNLHGHLQ
jgi:hypothetical protein